MDCFEIMRYNFLGVDRREQTPFRSLDIGVLDANLASRAEGRPWVFDHCVVDAFVWS
jgi:hypothetical protein